MTNYYYSSNPDVEHKEKKWNFELLGNNIHFTTDNGVFSKNTVDFGTRVLLETIDANLDLDNKKILDMGCGYGPIGLSLAFDTGREVEMVDINERAVELAKENAELNKIDHVAIYTSFIYESVENNQFAAIVSNPPIRAGKEVVHTIISGSHAKLVKGGTLTIVIQKKQGAPSAKAKMEEIFGNAEIVKKEKGYFILVSEKE